MEHDREIHQLFARFAAAAATGDVQAYRQLVNGPDPFQEELFLRNSLHLREMRLHMLLRRIEQDSATARLYFDILDTQQQVQEHGSLTVVHEALGWLIEEL